ncbi:MAG TPA: peptide-methionine (R)-S-oxide reductase MsrB [Candidatus Sulfotelmatobacter sp.]|nr:peptide-methionine (R)-S-oxide reductase MsrB [Candidatus Sulfotelmatobacter sp.]
MHTRALWTLATLVLGLLALAGRPWLALAGGDAPYQVPAGDKVKKVTLTDAEWKKKLTAQQYYVLREKGTDRAFTGELLHVKGKGVFVCAGCGLELFSTEQKFESGTGWPSFWAPIAKSHVIELEDHSLGMERIEVECARCGGHLGHVFDDGPAPTGLRYCMNSSALQFVPAH